MAVDTLYAEAGQGLDREAPKPDIESTVLPKARGVLFKMFVDFGTAGKRALVVRFPDEQHSERLTHHGADSESSIYTQAQIADIFMKSSIPSAHPSRGKWKQWSKLTMEDTVAIAIGKINDMAGLMIDSMVARARKEWTSTLLRKKSQDIIRPLRQKIDEAWKEQREHFRLAKEKMPDFERQFGSGGIKKIEAVAKAKAMFIKNRKEHLTAARELRQTHKELSSRLDELKREIVAKGMSKELADEISNMILFQRFAEDNNLHDLKRQYGKRLDALTAPFQVGSTLKKIMEIVGAKVRDRLSDLIAGMKSPRLARKTIYNRRWRGYSTEEPLHESGEFADSLIAEVI